MGRRSNFSKEVKVKACEEYLSGIKSVSQIASELSLNLTSIKTWIRYYQNYGESVFDEKPRNQSYSKDLKLQGVKEYLNGEGSLGDLSLKYNISKSIVLKWVKMYNSGKEIKDYVPKGEVYTMKARRTTFEERLEIVKFVLDHDKEYKLAAEKYFLPYSLVY